MTPGNAESKVAVVDLFAGPGGWDIGARSLGIDPLGIELDAAACATRTAAGLRTIKGDVSTPVIAEDAELWGLIASPPCQTFSMAGKGSGRKALDDVLLGVDLVARGLPMCEFDDPRTALVVEPLRYALLHEPEWVAWEQVPTVLPVWEACADVLRAEGYDIWTGNLHAEQYGVAQTRKRAALLGSRVRKVSMPTPTHSRYYPHKPDKLDPGVFRWVSMAEALGMGPHAGSMRSNYGTGGDPRKRGERLLSDPAAIVTTKIDRNKWTAVDWVHVNDAGEGRKAATRNLNEPAGTVYGRRTTSVSGYIRPRLGVRDDGIRVTVQEAGILQSFPADYPWRGTKTQQYQQVGNAIPPLFALHILSAVTGVALNKEDAA